MPFLRVYFASKTSHAQKWRDLDLNSKVLKVTSRWLKQVILDNGDIINKSRDIGRQGKDIRDFAARCWIEDQQDIQCADYLVLYAEAHEHLRGGLVEAGIAMEHGVPIIVIGQHPDYGSWQWHPQVMRLVSLAHLEEWAEQELSRRIESMKTTYLESFN